MGNSGIRGSCNYITYSNHLIMNVTCTSETCDYVLNSKCVFYEGMALPYAGINTNDSLETALQKINEAIQDITVSVSVEWGDITGLLGNQADLIAYFNNFTPTTRNLTINGVTYDLSADRSWTVGGGDMVLAATQTNTGAKTFENSTLLLNNPAQTFAYRFQSSAIAAQRNVTLPLLTSDDVFMFQSNNATISGLKSFVDGSLLIHNPALSFSYTLRSSAIAGNRDITLPLLTSNDTFVTANFSQALTNKSVNGVTLTTGGGTTNFLRADGTYAAPSGGGGSLAALSDVTLSTPLTTQFLQYDGADWVNAYFSNPVVTPTIVANAYTLQATDQNKILHIDNGSTNVTITLPDGLATNFSCTLVHKGTGGIITLVATTTLESYGTTIEIPDVGATVYHQGSNVWTAIGALGAGGGGAWSLASGGTATGTNTFAMGSNPFILTSGVTTGTGATAGIQNVFNSLTTGNGLDISSSSVTTGAIEKITSTSTGVNHTKGSGGLLTLLSSGTYSSSSRTGIGASFIMTNTGTTSTNIPIYVSSTGATTNNAIEVGGGDIILSQASAQKILKSGGLFTIGVSDFNTLALAVQNTNRLTINGSSGAFTFITNLVNSGSITPYTFNDAARTNQTASTESHFMNFTPNSFQYATGTQTILRTYRMNAATYSFVGASVIDDAYGLWVASPIASTNATITNNWSAGFEGNVLIGNRLNLSTVPVNDDTLSQVLMRDSGTGEVKYRAAATLGHVQKGTLTVAGGAILRGIGSTPVLILGAPGAGTYYNIIGITVSYNYGAAAYDFAAGEIPIFKFSGATDGGFKVPLAAINASADTNLRLAVNNSTVTDFNAIALPESTDFVLTTENGGDATTGDGDIDIVVYFTVETTNT